VGVVPLVSGVELVTGYPNVVIDDFSFAKRMRSHRSAACIVGSTFLKLILCNSAGSRNLSWEGGNKGMSEKPI
jgi:hypothetical protein